MIVDKALYLHGFMLTMNRCVCYFTVKTVDIFYFTNKDKLFRKSMYSLQKNVFKWLTLGIYLKQNDWSLLCMIQKKYDFEFETFFHSHCSTKPYIVSYLATLFFLPGSHSVTGSVNSKKRTQWQCIPVSISDLDSATSMLYFQPEVSGLDHMIGDVFENRNVQHIHIHILGHARTFKMQFPWCMLPL